MKHLLYALVLVLFISACKQKASAPSYIHLDNFVVTTNSLTQGTANQAITEAMVYIDDQNSGMYHLPITFPVTLTGTHKITVAPAVIENAIGSNARTLYLFLAAYDTIITLNSNATTSCTPRTKYRNNLKFNMIEDFENPTPTIVKTTFNTLDTLQRDSLPSDNIEPGHCALFDLPNGVLMEYVSKSQYSLPSSAVSSTFVEINYKSDLALAIGLYIEIPSQNTLTKTGVVTLNPKSTWSKAYINLTDVVSVKPSDAKFQLFISSYNGNGVNQKVFIDNIKILHFE